MLRVNADQEHTALTECCYVHPTEALADIRTATAAFGDLNLFVGFYSFSNGNKKKLVNLSGTIPVWYKGNVYDIPVCIWLHATHPQSPPKCFLRPSVTMVINPTCSCVDQRGQVHLPSLSSWQPGRSSLSAVLKEMSAAFQRETPLYSTRPLTPLPAPHPQSPLLPGDHRLTQSLERHRQYHPSARLPYPGSPSARHMLPSSSRASLDFDLQRAGDNAPPSTIAGAKLGPPDPDPGTERRVRRSYTEELLDLGITFEAPSAQSQSLPPTNPFARAPPPAPKAPDAKTEDIEKLSERLKLQRITGINEHNSNYEVTLGPDHPIQTVLPVPLLQPPVPFRHPLVPALPPPVPLPPPPVPLPRSVHNVWGAGVLQRDAERVPPQTGVVMAAGAQQSPIQVQKAGERTSSPAPVPDGVPREKSQMFLRLLSMEGRSFAQEEVLEAVQSCRDLPSALRYLSHECPICWELVSFSKIVTMTHCSCSFCERCFRAVFSSVIKERSILSVVCPLCGRPDVRGPGGMGEAMDYFNLLDTQIRHYLDPEMHELFQRKLRDQALLEMPNFRWCAHCSFGLLHEADRLRMDCPSCQKSTCSNCKSPWVPQHEGLSCELFRKWQRENNPDYQNARLEHLISRNKIDCPKCKFRFYLSKGGCLHLRCTQCQYEFCEGCKRPFRPGSACDFSAECGMKGLHAHHPRDCLYYLRDWSVPRLCQLLQHHKVSIPVEERGSDIGLCGVLEQREPAQPEEPCGKPAPAKYRGYCERHYKERLVKLINQKQADPAALFDADELVSELHRWRLPVPHRDRREPVAEYLQRLRSAMQPIGLVAQRHLVEKAGVAASASCPSLGDRWATARNNPVRGRPPDSQLLLLLND